MTVHPFAGLAERAGPSCPRVLINLDQVGSIGRRPNDVVLLGKCDEMVRTLCKALGWEAELEELWAKTEAKAAWEDSEADAEAEAEGGDDVKEETTAEELVGAITDAIGRQLNLEDSEAKTGDTTPTATPPAKAGDSAKKEAPSSSVKDDAKEDAAGKL